MTIKTDKDVTTILYVSLRNYNSSYTSSELLIILLLINL